MTILTLKQAPHLYSATVALIEKAFHYKKPHQFDVDFAPLVDESNWHNCFIKIENEKVISHIGVSEKTMLGVPVAMLGGIAVDESRRGEGFFQELMQDVIAEKRSDVACFILWSDQEKLYKKFGFHLCGSQFESPPLLKSGSFEKTKLHLLSDTDFSEVKRLYQDGFNRFYTSIDRTDGDWNQYKKIKSADLFLKRSSSGLESYFFMNKGQDLDGVIYEYGSDKSFEELLPELQAYGRVWSAMPPVGDAEAQYQFFLAPGDTGHFARLIRSLTNGTMAIRDINPLKQEVYFDFGDELLGLELEEFLRGVLGPGVFEELGAQLKPLYISGLASI